MSLSLSKIKLGPDLDTGLRGALDKGEAVAFYFAADSREIALLIHNNDVVGEDVHPDERQTLQPAAPPPLPLPSNVPRIYEEHGIGGGRRS